MKDYDAMIALAQSRGKKVIEFDYLPDNLESGVCYLGMISTHEPLIHHVVAIDEQGIVFDPDPAKEQSRESWRAYTFIAVLGFQALL